MCKHGWIEAHGQQAQVGAGRQARILLDLLTVDTDSATTVAQANMGHRAAEHKRYAHAIGTARSCRARVQFLAKLSTKSTRAFALERSAVDFRAFSIVQARVGLAQQGHFRVDVASLQVVIVHEHVRAVHDSELAESVADHKLGGITGVGKQITWLRVGTDVIANRARGRCGHRLLLLDLLDLLELLACDWHLLLHE